MTTYNALGPGYNDVSLNYQGDEVLSVAGTGTATVAEPTSAESTADERHTATVTIA